MMHMAIIYALNRGFKAVKADVQSAFLKAESDDELYLRMPNDIPKEAKELGYEQGGVYRQLKAVYGRADSPRLFTQAFKKACSDEGWKETQDSILLRMGLGEEIDGILLTHMDDLFCLAVDPYSYMKKLDKKFEMGEIEFVSSQQLCSYTGLDILWQPERAICKISQQR